MKITKVYTKTGDDGTTSLVGGVRINKSDVRLEAYGTVDELNSHLGLLIAYMYDAVGKSHETGGEALETDRDAVETAGASGCVACKADANALQDDIKTVERIQNNLFCVGTNLATDRSKTPLYPSAMLPDGEVEHLESEIDRTLSALPAEFQGFILPGGTLAAATAHVCRTVCRRAERDVVALSLTSEISPEVVQYLNRISDYMFVLAKKLNFVAGRSEKIWHNHCV